MQKDGSYLHAWDWRCKAHLQWAKYGRRQIKALLCSRCGQEYPVAGKSAYRLGGGVMALAAVEDNQCRSRRHK